MANKRAQLLFTITPTHWWYYLNPSWHRQRRIIHQWLNCYEKEISAAWIKAQQDLVLYGHCVIDANEIFGKGDLDGKS